jgi:hypothetical protein
LPDRSANKKTLGDWFSHSFSAMMSVKAPYKMFQTISYSLFSFWLYLTRRAAHRNASGPPKEIVDFLKRNAERLRAETRKLDAASLDEGK